MWRHFPSQVFEKPLIPGGVEHGSSFNGLVTKSVHFQQNGSAATKNWMRLRRLRSVRAIPGKQEKCA